MEHDNDYLLHELMDRAYLAAEFFAEHISSHPMAGCPAFAAKIERLEKKLFKLYHEIADERFA